MTLLRLIAAFSLVYLSGWMVTILLVKDRTGFAPAARFAFYHMLGIMAVGLATWFCTLFRIQSLVPLAVLCVTILLAILTHRSLWNELKTWHPSRLAGMFRWGNLIVLFGTLVVLAQFFFVLHFVMRMPSWAGDALRSSTYTGMIVTETGWFNLDNEFPWGIADRGHILADMTSVFVYRFIGRIDPLAVRSVEALHFLALCALVGGYLARRRSPVHGAILAALFSLTPVFPYQVIIGYRDLVLALYVGGAAVLLERFYRKPESSDALAVGFLLAGVFLWKRTGLVYSVALILAGAVFAGPRLFREGWGSVFRKALLLILPLVLAGIWVFFVERTQTVIAHVAEKEIIQEFQDPLSRKITASLNVLFYGYFLGSAENPFRIASEWLFYWPFILVSILLYPGRIIRERGFWVALIGLSFIGVLTPLAFGATLVMWLPSVERYLIPVSVIAFLMAAGVIPDLNGKRKESEFQGVSSGSGKGRTE